MAGKQLRYKIIEQFLAQGMNKMFGNPGTVEQGFLDTLKDYPEMKYILTLQESIAVLAADAHARSTQKPTLVQIHSTPGLGNSIGAMYQAMRGHSPLVIIGGDAGISYSGMDAQMAGDLVSMARPVTKYSAMIQDPRSALRMIRRAIKIAATAPMGPVYLCLPMDLLDAECTEDVYPAAIPSTRVAPERSVCEEAAQWLAAAERPRIYVGDGVAYSEATDEVTKLAEILGAEVYGVDSGDINMPWNHPLWMGMTGHMFGYHSKPILQEGDVNLITGTYMVPEVFPELGNIFSDTAKNIHFDLNAYEIAKNHPVSLSAVADPKITISKVISILENSMTEQQRDKAKYRVESLRQAKDNRLKLELQQDKAKENASPLDMSQFAAVLAEKMPPDAIIFDEALTSSPALTRYITPKAAGTYFQTRGGSLGVGIPGAIGLQLANPDKLVIGFTGDGGSMYTIQALWTAARHGLKTKFVICNNHSYHLLQLNMEAYWKERDIAKHEHPLPFDLSSPPIGFSQLAEAMGVKALRVEKKEEIASAIDTMLRHDGAFLIDLVLDGEVHPEKIGLHCGQ